MGEKATEGLSSPLFNSAGYTGSFGPARHQGPPRRTGNCPLPPALHLSAPAGVGQYSHKERGWRVTVLGLMGRASDGGGNAGPGALELWVESKSFCPPA